jgi:hypothetical protein
MRVPASLFAHRYHKLAISCCDIGNMSKYETKFPPQFDEPSEVDDDFIQLANIELLQGSQGLGFSVPLKMSINYIQ